VSLLYCVSSVFCFYICFILFLHGPVFLTLQDALDLIDDPVDTRRTRYDFEEPPFSLTSTEPFPSRHIFLVQSSDPQSYGEAAGNPFWESTIQEEYNSLLENQTWDMVPFPSGRKHVRCRWVLGMCYILCMSSSV
jgi:hypothetical protein